MLPLRKQVRWFSNLRILVQGHRWLKPGLTEQGYGGRPPWTGCLAVAGHTHTHTDAHWDNFDATIHLTHTPLGCGRKQVPETTPQRQWPRPGTDVFFINIITKQLWKNDVIWEHCCTCVTLYTCYLIWSTLQSWHRYYYFFCLVNEEAEDRKGFTASKQYCSFHFTPLLTRWG